MSAREDAAADTALARAVAQLAANKLVAYPTETVWGLAADSRSEVALQALRSWKGRAETQPISILVPDAAALESLGFELLPAAQRLMEKFWPGPLTLILPCRKEFARGIARGDGAVGVRCSSHPVSRALAQAALAAGLGPITTTSLNRSGAPPLQTLDEVRELCARAADDAELFVLAPDSVSGAESSADFRSDGAPSTVFDLASPSPRVLRSGAIAEDVIRQVLDTVLTPKNVESEK